MIDRILAWAARHHAHRQEYLLMRKYGGIQRCPWCRQWAQTGPDWSFTEWDRDPMLDKMTCGVCGGTSLWRFEVGMLYMGPLDPPRPSHPVVPYYDIENARLRPAGS